MSWKAASNLLVVLAVAATCLLGHLVRGKTPLAPADGIASLNEAHSHFATSNAERAEEADIQEAVFRYQLRQDGARPAPLYFLFAWGDGPRWPSPKWPSTTRTTLLRRLRRDGYRVAPMWRATALTDNRRCDRETGTPGVELTQTAIRWLGPREVQLDSSRYESSQRQSSTVYCLVRRAGVWCVSSATPFGG